LDRSYAAFQSHPVRIPNRDKRAVTSSVRSFVLFCLDATPCFPSYQIVRSGKDSIATILGDRRYVLPDVRGVSHVLPDFTEGFDLDWNVGNFSSEDLREDVSHFVLR
jgi:hypothetical protein